MKLSTATTFARSWKIGLAIFCVAPRALATDLDPALAGAWLGTSNAVDVLIQGNRAYVADGRNGLQILDVSFSASPQHIGHYQTSREVMGVAVAGNYACVAERGGGLVVVDLHNPANLEAVGNFSTGLFECAAVRIQGRYAYVLASSFIAANYGSRFYIIDITNPTSPRQVGVFGENWIFSGLAVRTNYAYVAGDAGLEVFDISNSGNPRRVANLFTAHSKDVVVQDDYAYLADAGAGLQVIDIRNPINPQPVGHLVLEGGSGRSVAVQGQSAYLSCSIGACDCLYVIDISNPAIPKRVGTYEIPQYASAYGVVVSGNYAYLAAGSGGLKVIDISRIAAPQRLGSNSSEDYPYLSAVVAQGHYAYAVDHKTGLGIFSISDPTSPVLVGGYNLSLQATDVAVAGNYAFLAKVTGLDILDIQNPASPQRVGGFYATNINGVAVRDNYAYLAGYWSGLEVIDISNPGNPQHLSWNHGQGARQVALQGNYAYVAHGYEGLVVIDISNPRMPLAVGRYDSTGEAWEVALTANYAYVADYTAGLHVVDIRNPRNPQRVGGIMTSSAALAVTALSNYVYVATRYSGVDVIDVSDPSKPWRLGHNSAFDSFGVAVGADKLVVAAASDGLLVLDMFRLPRLEPVGWSPFGEPKVAVYGTRGMSVQLQRSGNLRDWFNWGAPFILDADPIERIDPEAIPLASFFYRAAAQTPGR